SAFIRADYLSQNIKDHAITPLDLLFYLYYLCITVLDKLNVLALDYPRLEIIVLNDRSSDATPEILERMTEQHPRLRVIHIRELPKGWLGKNYALHFGAEHAKGEFLLFTDADAQMKSDTISRVVARMEEGGLDHLCLTFRPDMPSSLLSMLVVDSLSVLLTIFKPWLTVNPNSRYFMGIGAFNFVRSSTYSRLGGHRPIRLCPVDDILLGRLVKESGGRQECLNGTDFVRVPWYSSVSEMADGLCKNILAVIDYRLDLLVAATLLIICCNIMPFLGLFFTEGIVRLLCGSCVVVAFLSMLVSARVFGIPPSCLRWFLFTPYIKLYMIWRAALTTLTRGGIDWRGTFYPLDDLKRYMVPVWPWRKLRRNFWESGREGLRHH
ncbi:MAG: glycosyltransferase, partial [Candidatus Electrothrix sp. AR4]|nr:glycosyltransferase [Candidatus Electrothrix sp. AR4]